MGKRLILKEKNLKSIKGITLISLIITIVIMLILAAVSINLIIGDNGLFNKANMSAKTYNKESVREELQIASNNAYLDDTNQEITNDMIADGMNDGLNISWYDRSMLSGNYKGYDFYIDDNHTVIMEKLDVEPIVLINVNSSAADKLKDYCIEKDKVKNIVISIAANPMQEATANAITGKIWNAAESKDNSIVAYYKDSGDTNFPYDLHIVGKRQITLPENCISLFYGYQNIETATGFENLNTSKVTNMQYMFHSFGYNNLKSLDLGNNFDVSNVTNMYFMFYDCGRKAMESLNLGNNFNPCKVTNMGYMFAECGQYAMTSFNLGNNFNTTSATDTMYMFKYCGQSKLVTLNLGEHFDTTNVTTMDGMFESCGRVKMTSLNLGENFNTSNVTTMYEMFDECGQMALQSLDLGKKFNTSKVTNMQYMFQNCGQSAMTSLNLGSNFYTSRVTDMGKMFSGCGYNLESLILGAGFSTTSGVSMYEMFQDCGQYKMTSLDLGPNFVLSSTDKSGAFNNTGKVGCIFYCANGQASAIRSTVNNTNKTVSSKY